MNFEPTLGESAQHEDSVCSSPDRKQRSVERAILAGVLTVPVAILGLGYLRLHFDSMSFTFATSALAKAQWLADTILFQCLFVWLAFRAPILGHSRLVAVAVIALALTCGATSMYWASDAWRSAEIDSRFIVTISLYSTLLGSLTAVLFFVVARRVSSIVLIRKNEPSPTFRAISISELMLWTFFVACFLGCRVNLAKVLKDSGTASVSMPIWWEICWLLRESLPAILILAIVLCWRLPKWKWLPPLVIAYVGLTSVYAIVEHELLKIAIGPVANVIRSNWIHHFGLAVVSVAISVFIVWLFNWLGYRFYRIQRKKIPRLNSQ